MKANPLSPNIYVVEDSNFEEYNKEVVHRLLQQVQIDFSNWIGDSVFQTINCFLFYQDECPEIYSLGEAGHRLCLCVKGDDWWRWVYQFAHEYCHHIINGTMSGELKGLMWFEETICKLASICHLNRLIALCDALQIDNQYKTFVISCYNANLGTLQKNSQEYLKSVADQLAEPVYHREIYSNLSATMLPLFLDNPHLWKIILHFGDMRQWNSLEDLFQHLERNATVDYVYSLKKLRLLLFS